MNSSPPEQQITFKAPWTAPAFFLMMLMLVGTLLIVGFQLLGAPWQVLCFLVGMITIAFLLSIEIALYRLRVSEGGISESRFAWRKDYGWEDVVGWTRWGTNNLLFIRLRSGRTIGTDRPGFGNEEVDALAEILNERVGPMLQGGESILPWYLEWTLGGLMRSGTPK